MIRIWKMALLAGWLLVAACAALFGYLLGMRVQHGAKFWWR